MFTVWAIDAGAVMAVTFAVHLVAAASRIRSPTLGN
ncbi:hypothetical protein J2W15_001905 [Pseudarthrobacter sulfonivorans]|nr:hypothetical protein [Pseudarthrobacter sulfonivorans]